MFPPFKHWLQALLVAFFLAPSLGSAANALCKKSDNDALLGFKSSLNSSSEVLPLWKNTVDCCQWQGVSCNSNGSIIGLSLSSSKSKLSVDKTKSFNPVSKYLVRVKSLQLLDLSNVDLYSWPSGLSQLSQLRLLNLSGTSIENITDMPKDLARLQKLEQIDLSSNFNSGMKDDIISILCGLKNLNLISLSSAAQLKTIPRCLSQLFNLTYLDLSYVYLSAIPTYIDKFSNLKYLDLSGNGMLGMFNKKIPLQLCNLKSLDYLGLHHNSGLHGSIPACIGQLTNLTELSVGYCQLDGKIPESIANLTKLRRLNLAGNNFVGPIPSWLGLLTNLEDLDLSGPPNWEIEKPSDPKGALYTGNIPESIGNLVKLRYFAVEGNLLTGSIPSSFAKLSNIETLRIIGKNLTGSLPDFSKLVKLQYCYINGRGITGTIPASIGNCTGLQMLILSNTLTGPIPKTIKYLRKLFLLNLDGNKLSGSMPTEFGKLGSLFELKLQGNKLGGRIPAQIGNLHELAYLDLSSNKLTGQIPSSFLDLNQLKNLNLSHNHLTGAIPQGGKLSSFPSSAFASNDGLCGAPLSSCK